MTNIIPSPDRRRALPVLATSLALLLAACGSSGDEESADTTAAPTTEAPATTEAEAPAEAPAEEPAEDSGAVVFGDLLFEADPSDPTVGGFSASDSLRHEGDAIAVSPPANSARLAMAADERFEGDVHVATTVDAVRSDATPDASFGVVCKASADSWYMGMVANLGSNRYQWGIIRVSPSGPELLAGFDGDAIIQVPGAVVPIGLSCNRNGSTEVLDLLVGEDYVGQAVDPEPLEGSFAGLSVENADFEGPTHFTSMRVYELVPA